MFDCETSPNTLRSAELQDIDPPTLRNPEVAFSDEELAAWIDRIVED